MSQVTYEDLLCEETAELDQKAPAGGTFSFFSSLTGSSVLTEEKLAPVLEKVGYVAIL